MEKLGKQSGSQPQSTQEMLANYESFDSPSPPSTSSPVVQQSWVVELRTGIEKFRATVLAILSHLADHVQNASDSVFQCLRHDRFSWPAISFLLSYEYSEEFRGAVFRLLANFMVSHVKKLDPAVERRRRSSGLLQAAGRA